MFFGFVDKYGGAIRLGRKGERAERSHTAAMRDSILFGLFDYAGLFPPASLTFDQAIQEYEDLDGLESDMTSGFLISAGEARQQAGVLRDSGLLLQVVARPWSGPEAWKEDLSIAMELSAETIQIAAPAEALGALARAQRQIEQAGAELYLECAWGSKQADLMAEAAEKIEYIGFKARCGGAAPADFPSTHDLARFIVEAISLEAPAKFTAGLHEPLRHHDPILGAHRHGFLNVAGAWALAAAHALSAREVEEILLIDSADAISLTDDLLRMGRFSLSSDDEAESDALDLFGGIGSCSIAEPAAGLRRLGLA